MTEEKPKRGLREVVETRWKWLLPLIVVMPVALFSPATFKWYYHTFEEPKLRNPGVEGIEIFPSGKYTSVLPGKTPARYDFVRVDRGRTGRLTETFYFSDASTFALESTGTAWRSTSTHCIGLERQSWVIDAGMAVMLLLILCHSIRTLTFFYIPFLTKRQPLNDFETVLAIYAVCLFGGGMLSMVTAACEASGAMRFG
jgi:hypothetical protein